MVGVHGHYIYFRRAGKEEMMKSMMRFIEEHRIHFFEILRIYLGFFLIIKGMELTGSMESLLGQIGMEPGAYTTLGIAHYVFLANILGGSFLIVGLLTRWAALLNVPNLLGAIYILSRGQTFFAPGSEIPVTVIVALMVIVFSLTGSGPVSLDHYLEEYTRKHNMGMETFWERMFH